VQDIAVKWEIDLLGRPDDDVFVVLIVFFEVPEKAQDFVLSNAKVFVGRGVSRARFSDDQDIELFG
jgi:hypothetical protein